MINWQLFTAFLLITFVLVITPGPIVTLVIATGATRGIRAALTTVIGTTLGNAVLLAAIALVMPGIGPIVAAGPLSAGLGEAAGHVAGNLASVLTGAGIDEARAESLQREVEQGAVLLGVHVHDGRVAAVRDALVASGARVVDVANWSESA